jgi:hypothetical protein
MQFLSPQFGLFTGKINTLDSSGTEFYGDYRTQFENAAFNFPTTLRQLPLAAFGGGVVALPRDDVILSALLVDPSGSPENDNLGKAFSDGVMVVGSGQLTVKPFGLVGHRNLGRENWHPQVSSDALRAL